MGRHLTRPRAARGVGVSPRPSRSSFFDFARQPPVATLSVAMDSLALPASDRRRGREALAGRGVVVVDERGDVFGVIEVHHVGVQVVGGVAELGV